jgi:hypothetical protein
VKLEGIAQDIGKCGLIMAILTFIALVIQYVTHSSFTIHLKIHNLRNEIVYVSPRTRTAIDPQLINHP